MEFNMFYLALVCGVMSTSSWKREKMGKRTKLRVYTLMKKHTNLMNVEKRTIGNSTVISLQCKYLIVNLPTLSVIIVFIYSRNCAICGLNVFLMICA